MPIREIKFPRNILESTVRKGQYGTNKHSNVSTIRIFTTVYNIREI